MERFAPRLRQELENLLLLDPDITGDFYSIESLIEHAKEIVKLDRLPTNEGNLETVETLLSELRNRELVSLYLRLCENRILSVGEVNEILNQVRHEFIEYGDGFVLVDHGIRELKDGIQEAVDILEALGFNNTKNELQTASDDLVRGVWDTAVWRSSKTIEGVCKEVARKYHASHGGTLREPWNGMVQVQNNLTSLGYWHDEEPLKKMVDYLRITFRNKTAHFDEDQTEIDNSGLFSEESAYIIFQLSHLICLSMLRRLS
ncbi:MAG: hypothetical protein ACTSWA_01680 [Candidatus Thorarchaeota archaeon]